MLDQPRPSFSELYDERFGIVMQMGFDPIPAWEPQVQLVTVRLSRELLPDKSDTLRQCYVSGHGFDRQQALDSAIGEAMERLYGGFSNWTAYKERPSDVPVIDLAALPQFSDLELKHLDSRYDRRGENSNTPFYPAVKLGTKKCFQIPAQLVFCPYHPYPDEKLFWEPTTNGLAAGPSVPAAQVSGLLEVIERDALALSWLLRIPGQELSARDVLGDDYNTVTHALLRGPVTIRLAVVSLDIPVPVCVAAIYHESTAPAVAFGSGAATELAVAAKKALCEAALVRYTLRLRATVLRDVQFHPEDCDPHTFQEHGLAWIHPEDAAKTEWIFGNRTVEKHSNGVRSSEPGAALNQLLRIIADAGYEAYGCDLLTCGVNTGAAVQRLLIPGLQPLNPGRHRRMLLSKRLTRIHEWLYGTPHPLVINNSVHPFC